MKLLKALAAILVILVAGTFIWLDLSGDGTIRYALAPGEDGDGATTTSGGARTNGIIVADPSLLEDSPTGALPRVDEKGRMPWKIYRAKYKPDGDKPKIAILIANLGLKSRETQAAIKRLPPAVTLAFSPYASDLSGQVRAARLAGHEVLLSVPMEPKGYPNNDPGAQTLLTSRTVEQNIAMLKWSMGRFPGYVGILPHMGERFLASREHLRPVLQEIKVRGLLFVDPDANPGSESGSLSEQMKLPTVRVNGVIDTDPTRQSIVARLNEIAAGAKKRGYAVAIGRPYPATVEMVRAWISTFEERGLEAVPVSALAEAAMKGK